MLIAKMDQVEKDIEISKGSSHDFTNDPSIIEARFAKEMSRVCKENRNWNKRLSAFEQGKFDDDYEDEDPPDRNKKKGYSKKKDREASDPDDSSSSSSSSSSGSSSSNSSKSSVAKHDVIAGLKSIDKDRRASGFLSENEVRAHKKALRSERNHSGGISVKQLPTEKDLWLNDLGILNLLSFEAKYVILQQEWTDVLKIGRYMTAEV